MADSRRSGGDVVITYRGVRKDGMAITGAIHEDSEPLDALVERHYSEGVRQAVYFRGVRKVAQITRASTGQRVWWADCS
jgi:hypothetical protein